MTNNLAVLTENSSTMKKFTEPTSVITSSSKYFISCTESRYSSSNLKSVLFQNSRTWATF